jgi:hypothetical protein
MPDTGIKMLPHQVVAVAVRLFAISLALAALNALPIVTIGQLSLGGHSPGFVYSLFLIVLTMALALLLWVFPYSVAGKLVPKTAEPAAETTAADTWLAIGCAVIGLWILSRALPGLLRDVYVLRTLDSYADAHDIKSWALFNFIQLVIAAWLAFGSAGFRKLFWTTRNRGVRKSS